ncbi:MAG: UDP-2,3-diacylglucosamine diphosphatase [Planctomycetes bacterium]|nr:UDP-2,3-diacylglucosamine diphosphatase [Planctomycetota bacterium]
MDSQTVFFVADAHLMPGENPEQESKLQQLLASAEEQGAEVVFLGDMFNFWFERKGVVIGDYSSSLALVKAFTAKGYRAHHVCGNRDFIIGGSENYKGGFLGNDVNSCLQDYGINLHGDRYMLEIAGKKVLAIHGDQFCTSDSGYQFLRRFLHGWLIRFATRITPAFMASPIVSHYQTRPTRKGYNIPPPEYDIQDSAVRREIEGGADYVFCGHVHHHARRAISSENRKGGLVVVPPWIDRGEYIIFDGNEISISE